MQSNYLYAVVLLAGGVFNAGSTSAQSTRMSDDEILRRVNENVDQASKARSEGRGPKHPDLPKQDPCSLLTAGEVNAAVSGAGPGQRDRFNEEEGIARCRWKSANGAPLLVIELVAARAGQTGRSAADEMARGRPPGAQVRTLAVGDGGVAFFLPRDPKVGLTRDMASAVARSGKVDVNLSSDALARRGVDPALSALESLLKKAVARL